MSVQLLRGVGEEWRRCVSEMLEDGIAVPLSARPEYAARLGGKSPQLVVVRSEDGRCRAALALDMAVSRALPGHRIARAHHCGSVLVGNYGEELLAGLAAIARANPWLLRITIEVVLREAAQHKRLAQIMQSAGFAPARMARSYRHTLLIDLAGTEEDLLGSFSATTRRELRGWLHRPLEMRVINDARYEDRLNRLARETFERTGGPFVSRPWGERIALGRELPTASRLVGLFRVGEDSPESLLAYAWGCAHGDYAHYDDAGSTRVDDIKGSLMYPLMWDLIRWSKSQGCSWFDMGGITLSSRAEGDPRGGITEFKRRFSKVEADAGAEWELEPHPLRSGVLRLLRRARNPRRRG